jgi:hypothetical protein
LQDLSVIASTIIPAEAMLELDPPGLVIPASVLLDVRPQPDAI